MKAGLFFAYALLACGAAMARPLVIESNEQPPFLTGWLSHTGDELVTVVRQFDSPTPGSPYVHAARVYAKNSSGQWALAQTLATEPGNDYVQRSRVAMTSSLIAIGMPSGLRVFEKTVGGWVESPVAGTRPLADHVDVHGDTILATTALCTNQAAVLHKNASGQWATTATLLSQAGNCILALDLDENNAIVSSQPPDWEQHGNVRIFERTGSGWVSAANLPTHESLPGYWGQGLAIRGNLALVGGRDRNAHVFRRRSTGWIETGHLDTPGRGEWDHGSQIQITDDHVFILGGTALRYTGAVVVYRQHADESFEHLANLVGDSSHPHSLFFAAENRVIALTGDHGTEPIEFNLSASFDVPDLVQYDFEDNDTSAWTPLPGSMFSVVDNGTTNVFHQSSQVGDAGALHSADMTNQSIAADVQPTAFNGADRWVGLMTRYVDAANHYYVTLRGTNQVVLKRMLNGVFTELGVAFVPVHAGSTFHLRLESSGSNHTVFVDNVLVINHWDLSHSHGRTGLRMYKAAANFDNIVVSPGPTNEQVWANVVETGGNWTGTPTQFQHTTASGTARHISGTPAEDQIVQSLIRVNQFSTGGSPWAGLIARYVDDGNYFYVTVRKTNELSLRKLTNGSITVLATAPLNVNPHLPFVLRLEAIQEKLRVYVNGVLKMEQGGAEIVAGRFGAMAYRTSANFSAYKPLEP